MNVCVRNKEIDLDFIINDNSSAQETTRNVPNVYSLHKKRKADKHIVREVEDTKIAIHDTRDACQHDSDKEIKEKKRRRRECASNKQQQTINVFDRDKTLPKCDNIV